MTGTIFNRFFPSWKIKALIEKSIADKTGEAQSGKTICLIKNFKGTGKPHHYDLD